MELKIYVADLERYNSGYLVGKWYDLADYSDSDELLEDIGVMLEENGNEEWAIHDIDCDNSQVYKAISEYTSLDTIFALIDKINEDEEKALAILEYEDIQTLIDCDLDDYILYSDIHTHEDLGYYWLEESGCYDVPENLKFYIDYERYGRDVDMESTGAFTDYGYLNYVG